MMGVVRIAHVITGLETGGAEKMLLKLISRSSGAFKHVVISLRTIGTVGQLLQARNIQVIALNSHPGRFSVALLFRLATQLRFVKPDIVQGWMYHGNFAAFIAKRMMGAGWPLCWSIRCSIGDPGTEKWITRAVRRVCAPIAGSIASIIYNSDRARHQHECAGYSSAKGVVIPNGFDTEVFRPNALARIAFRQRFSLEEDQPIIGHIARFDPMKDQATLVAAALKVARCLPNAIFIFAGPGMLNLPGTPDSTASVLTLLKNKVIFLPEQENVAELMSAFDVFVLSSAFGEGFPNVLGEALSCGVPCVATDVGDCADVVGDCGAIVPPRDPEKLAAAILHILTAASSEREALSRRARRRAEQYFSIADVVTKYESAWHFAADLPCLGEKCAG